MAARTQIARTQIWEEPNGSFGIDGTGTLANFLDLRTLAPSIYSPARVSLPDERTRAYRVDQPKDLFGYRSGSFDWQGHLISHGVPLNTAASPPSADALGTLLKATLGGRAIAAGTAVVASPSPTTTSFSVTPTHGARIPPGTIVWVQNTVTGRFVPAKIKTVSTDAVTLACALPFTPTTAAIVYNGEQFYETDKPNTSLQMIVEGENRNGDVHVLMGCHASLGLELTLGQLAKVTAQMMVAKGVLSAATAGNPASARGLSHSLAGSSPIPFTTSQMVFAPSGATTRVAPPVDSVKVNFNTSYTPIASIDGAEGVAERVRISSEVTVEISLPVNDTTPDEYLTARDAGTTYQMLLNLNDQTPGSLAALEIGTLQIRDVKRMDKGGVRYQSVTGLALPDDNATDKSTDQRRSPVRLARG